MQARNAPKTEQKHAQQNNTSAAFRGSFSNWAFSAHGTQERASVAAWNTDVMLQVPSQPTSNAGPTISEAVLRLWLLIPTPHPRLKRRLD